MPTKRLTAPVMKNELYFNNHAQNMLRIVAFRYYYSLVSSVDNHG